MTCSCHIEIERLQRELDKALKRNGAMCEQWAKDAAGMVIEMERLRGERDEHDRKRFPRLCHKLESTQEACKNLRTDLEEEVPARNSAETRLERVEFLRKEAAKERDHIRRRLGEVRGLLSEMKRRLSCDGQWLREIQMLTIVTDGKPSLCDRIDRALAGTGEEL